MEAGILGPCLHVAISYTEMPIQSGIMPDINLMHEWLVVMAVLHL